MNSRAGRIALIVIGAIALLTGDRTWLYIGPIVGVVGVVLLMLGIRDGEQSSAVSVDGQTSRSSSAASVIAAPSMSEGTRN